MYTHMQTHTLCLFDSHHLVARVYESKAEFRSALQHEKEGYTIYKNQVCHMSMEHARKKKKKDVWVVFWVCPGIELPCVLSLIRWEKLMKRQRRALSI